MAKSISDTVIYEIGALKINQSISVSDLILKAYKKRFGVYYDPNDYFVKRSFDVSYAKAKKILYFKHEIKISKENGFIRRIENRNENDNPKTYFGKTNSINKK